MYNNTDYDLSKPLMIKRSGDIKNPLNKNKTHRLGYGKSETEWHYPY